MPIKLDFGNAPAVRAVVAVASTAAAALDAVLLCSSDHRGPARGCCLRLPMQICADRHKLRFGHIASCAVMLRGANLSNDGDLVWFDDRGRSKPALRAFAKDYACALVGCQRILTQINAFLQLHESHRQLMTSADVPRCDRPVYLGGTSTCRDRTDQTELH